MRGSRFLFLYSLARLGYRKRLTRQSICMVEMSHLTRPLLCLFASAGTVRLWSPMLTPAACCPLLCSALVPPSGCLSLPRVHTLASLCFVKGCSPVPCFAFISRPFCLSVRSLSSASCHLELLLLTTARGFDRGFCWGLGLVGRERRRET